MAITQLPLSITFTATNDGVVLSHPRYISAVTIWAIGATAGQRITLRDNATPGQGSILCDYVIDAAIDNADLWVGRKPQRVFSLSLDDNVVDGTWALTVFTWDERNR